MLRVIVLGGTQFIGRAIVEELVAHRHVVLVVHRGEHEPPALPGNSCTSTLRASTV